VREQFKKIPEGLTIYDYYFDLKKDKEFKPWADEVPEFVYDKETPYFDLMVATQETVLYSFMVESFLAIEKPLFFTGASGIGKSLIISKTLAQLKEHGNMMLININMSALTSSASTQQSIEEKLEKKKRTLYGA